LGVSASFRSFLFQGLPHHLPHRVNLRMVEFSGHRARRYPHGNAREFISQYASSGLTLANPFECIVVNVMVQFIRLDDRDTERIEVTSERVALTPFRVAGQRRLILHCGTLIKKVGAA
jgi:hypothetical protein